MKKFMNVMVMMAIAGLAMNLSAALDGAGTAENPFLINSVDDLREFAASVNNGEDTYNASGVVTALAADLDMAGEEFEGIGIDGCGFVGTFDGKDHTISNLTIEDMDEGAWAIGFIKCLGDYEDYTEGTIRNVSFANLTVCAADESDAVGLIGMCDAGIIESVNISGPLYVAGGNSIGGLVGCADLVAIRDCTVSCRSGSSVNGNCNIGGLVGCAVGEGTIESCQVRNVKVNGKAFAEGLVGDVYGELEIVDSEYKKPALLVGFGAGNSEPVVEEEEEEEDVEEEYVLPTHEGVEAIEPEATEIPFEGIKPETVYGEEYFAEVRDFADYLATNGQNCAEFKSEDLDLFRFANWVAGASGAATVEELLSVKNLFAAYAFNQRFDAFANSDPSLVIEVMGNTPSDGYSTIIMHVKAGATELDVNGINANVVLKYRQQLTDNWSEFDLAEECIEIVGTQDGHTRATLVIPPPEGASAFFSVSVL